VGQEDHVLRFSWTRDNGAWRLAFAVDGRQIWSFATRREGVLALGNEAGGGFSSGEPGDPAAIFQRAFDDPRHGLYVVINLSFGGRPFGDAQADLQLADFFVRRVVVT